MRLMGVLRNTWLLFFVVLLAGCAMPGTPRGHRDRPVSIADPKFLEEYATTRRFSAGYPTAIKIVPDGSAVLFLRSGPRDNIQNLYEFDTATGNERVLLTASKVGTDGLAQDKGPSTRVQFEVK